MMISSVTGGASLGQRVDWQRVDRRQARSGRAPVMLPRPRRYPCTSMYVDLAGRAGMQLETPDERVERYLRGQLAPFEPSEAAAGSVADVVLAAAADPIGPPRELQGPADDDLLAGTDGKRLLVTWDGRWCTIPDVIAGRPARFDYEPGFPIWRVFRSAIRPALQIAMAAEGRAAAVHAAAVTVGDAAVVVAGWSESGKTETALGLMEAGASFLSDKWTPLGPDGIASPFPITVGIRRWVLEYLPTLRAAVTRSARTQFVAARVASVVLRPTAHRAAPTRAAAMLSDSARKVAALGDRAAFEVAELREAYGQVDDPTRTAPTRLVVLLENTPRDQVVAVPADPILAASRLARSAAYERRAYFSLLQRAGYLLPDRPATVVERAIALDEALLREAFTRVELVTVRAPFPTDPRRVADEILRVASS